jgi:hypothetical protein
VYLIYLDEAGSSAQEPIHVIAAIALQDKKWLAVEAAMEEVIEQYVPEKDRPKFEFHTSDIFQGHGYFEHWERKVRAEVLKALLKVIIDHDLSVIYGGVHKSRLSAQYIYPADHHSLAFLLCAERIEHWFVKNHPDETGMLIADETKAKSEIKKSLKQYRKSGIPLGIREERLEHIIDTIHFADSHESCGIQLADFCSYIIKRSATGKSDCKELR